MYIYLSKIVFAIAYVAEEYVSNIVTNSLGISLVPYKNTKTAIIV